MKIEIRGVRDVGMLERERVILKAIADEDLGFYVLVQGLINQSGKVSNELTPLHWFHDKKVSAGDLIVVYSKSGFPTTKVNKDNSKSHFLYLDAGQPLWVGRERAVVLVYVETWEHFAIPPDEEETREP